MTDPLRLSQKIDRSLSIEEQIAIEGGCVRLANESIQPSDREPRERIIRNQRMQKPDDRPKTIVQHNIVFTINRPYEGDEPNACRFREVEADWRRNPDIDQVSSGLPIGFRDFYFCIRTY